MKPTYEIQVPNLLESKVIAGINTATQLATAFADAALSRNIKLLEKVVVSLSPDQRAIYYKHFGEAPRAERLADDETLYNATFEATVNALAATINEMADQQQTDGARAKQLQTKNRGVR